MDTQITALWIQNANEENFMTIGNMFDYIKSTYLSKHSYIDIKMLPIVVQAYPTISILIYQSILVQLLFL